MAELKVHPAAAVFPMLSEDELADLAEDIKANGLLHPIVLDAEGVVIDGRNRLAACKLAGIEPTFTSLNGHDPVAFILSANVQRRQMSKGQVAMATVLAHEAAGNFITSRDAAAQAGLKQHVYIVQARTVLEHAPDLIPLVMDKGLFLTDAYKKARSRKEAAETATEEDARLRAEVEAKTIRLRGAAPDLADLVEEWRLSLDDAVAVLDRRIQEERERKQRATLGFAKATSYLHALLQADPQQIAMDWTPKENTLADLAGCERLWTAHGLRELAGWMARAADAWGEDA